MPKVKPTHLKKLTGNPGKRALNHNEPVPPNELVEAPAMLSESARETWQYIINESPPGLIKTTDAHELLQFCVAFEMYQVAYKECQEQGQIVMCPTTLKHIPNPYISMMNKQGEIMSRTGSALGLSPAARSKLSVQAGVPPKSNEWAKFSTLKTIAKQKDMLED